MNQHSLAFKALAFYGTRMHHRGQWRVHAQLRQLFDVNLDCDMDVERAGLRWVLNPSDYMQRNLFWLAEHDRWDAYHIKRLLPAGAVVCDVGANFGYYSLTLAAFLKRNGRLFAFEPNPATRIRLERNIALNQLGNVITVIPYALSDTQGTARMTSRKDNTGAAHICQGGETEVEVTTLDSICAKQRLSSLDFVKIDVEGFEAHVLRGGECCLKTFRPILLVEFMAEQLERAGSSATELASLLRDYGYVLHVSERKRLVPLNLLPTGSHLINVLCLPASLCEPECQNQAVRNNRLPE
jgi:FkbM family methyltransferase